MNPIKEGRIGGTTSSNALPHADFVKVRSLVILILTLYDPIPQERVLPTVLPAAKQPVSCEQ